MTGTLIRLPLNGGCHRVHRTQPESTGLPFTEWAIEQQMHAALAQDCAEPIAALVAFNPAMADVVSDGVDELCRLGVEIAHAECIADWPGMRVAQDEYAEALVALARELRSGR